ncbi:MAG: CsgG/HfaB family protein [Sulfurimonas sp.]|uniref:CsgG/HfaB family protein n=1 Tax=Sulfurimonas sp. TaxID=2022749 RepID=UPI002637393B|nr:CsgG/HfaB family protein [Sulfurimonas sp.]MDD5372030.1 CsgG/HfaB family protein [Sulfurimonas sp.]
MKKYLNFVMGSCLVFMVAGCGVSTPNIVKVEKPTSAQPQVSMVQQEPELKRKVAIARFGNEAQYGKSALFGVNSDYVAEKQATDILSAKLAQSGKFILLERSDIDIVNKEINTFNLQLLQIGSDYLIVGSVTEFGRKNMSDTGAFSRSKTQIAYAKVSVRLIDVKTGQVVFAQEGSGEALSEAGTSFGLGKHVGYDSTLNDKAISAAISSVVDGIMENLLNKPWRSYVLSVEDGNAIIAGGAKQGLHIGDSFDIYQNGKSIKNPQTGMMIELPGVKVATVKVISQFGSTYTDEGSVCQVVNGNLNAASIKDLYVQK